MCYVVGQVLKQINRLKTKLRECTMFKKRRSDLVGKYGLVDKQEKKLNQLQSLRKVCLKCAPAEHSTVSGCMDRAGST